MLWVICAALAGVALAALRVWLFSPQDLPGLDFLERAPSSEFRRPADSTRQRLQRLPRALVFTLLWLVLRIFAIAVLFATTALTVFGAKLVVIGGLVGLLAAVFVAESRALLIQLALSLLTFGSVYLLVHRAGWALYGKKENKT